MNILTPKQYGIAQWLLMVADRGNATLNMKYFSLQVKKKKSE